MEKSQTAQTSDNEVLNSLISKAKKAQQKYATFTQEQVDEIFRACAIAANKQRIPLAKMACEETGMGIVEDKVIKNHFASEYIYNKYRDVKTCGIIEEDTVNGMKKIAEPVGVIAGVVPTTNPTSTAIFKALISLKTRNAIVFSPHPRAKQCTAAACKLINDVAVQYGAPDGLVACIEEPTVALSAALMGHEDIALILATGGPGMVKAAYSQGKPAVGVGPGNTPVLIDENADIKMTVSSVLISKTFDNGVICASEQSIVADASVYEDVKKEFLYRGAYVLSEEEANKVRKIIHIDGALNAKIVGRPACEIAAMGGVTVPEHTKVLIAEITKIGHDEPFSCEKLSPVLGMFKYPKGDFKKGVDLALELVHLDGLGHTACYYTHEDTQTERINYFASQIPTGRILINTPAAHGAIGDLYNFRLEPTLTIGCGSWGHNVTAENVGVKHLLNIKSVAARRENMLWYKVPPKIYFKRGSTALALREYAGKKRAFVVTDKPLYDLGMHKVVTNLLEELNISYEVFFDVEPDPTLATVRQAMEVIKPFQPDLFIAIGGGSPMDAAKIMWLLYERPETKFEDIAMRFMDIRKRICDIPALGQKAEFVAIPTTSGTGSEVTPFAVITDDNGVKYPIADYALTPHMAIVDADLVMSAPKSVTVASGIDVLTHAFESYVSVVATEFNQCNAKEAITLIFKHLPASYREGAANPIAREKVHYAATLAGMSFANGFLGICHSLAHKMGAKYHIPHGIANAMLMNQVARFNANDCPTKMGTFSQYQFPQAKARYAEIADLLNLGGKTEDEKVTKLLDKVTELKKDLDVPLSIKEYNNGAISEKEFMANLDELCELAFDDQCTGANPVYPLMSEIKQIYIDAFHGKY